MTFDPTYTVHRCDHGVWVAGGYAATADLAALLKQWHYDGYRWASTELVRKLGAVVAVVKSTGDEQQWLAELGEEWKP